MALMAVLGAAIPVLTTVPESTVMASIPQAIVGISISTFGVQLAVPWSIAALAIGAGAYTWGTVTLIGSDSPLVVHDLLFMIGGWLVAVLVRLMIGRVATTADQAHQDRLAAEVANGVAEASRNDDREQLALLHDTAAATLLLVGQAAPVPVERLAAQASRDLAVLQARPVNDPLAPVDLIQLLWKEAVHLDLPVDFTGLDHLCLDGVRATALCAASREALNNVGRHAGASSVTIYAGSHRLEITDNGRGIVSGTGRGHGIDESIVARMQRIGGSARIHSVPGVGTTVELQWADEELDPESADTTDEVVQQVRAWYGLALTAAALVFLAVVLWRALANTDAPELQIGLAVLAALCALAAPIIPHRSRSTVWVVAAVLVGIAVVQKGTLDESALRTYADWSLGAIGFCLLPHLIRLPAARSLPILLGVWTISALAEAIRGPSLDMVVYLGAAVAGFLIPQIAACLFSASVWDTLRDAQRENHALLRLETQEAVAVAMQSECVRRYSVTVDRLVPILRTLSHGGPITDELRRRARTEYRQLRTLFDESSPETPLLSQRIQSLIAQAEERGVDVTAHVDVDLPMLHVETAEQVLNHVDAALEQARSWARIVLTTAHDEVDLSVVCDVSDGPYDESRQRQGDVEVVVADDTMWMTLRAG
jgi:hypothetical protein